MGASELATDNAEPTGSTPPAEPEAKPVPGQAHLFAPENYKVTTVEVVLGGITIEDSKLAEAVLDDELHLNIRDARVAAIQYRRDGTKRITLHADPENYKVTTVEVVLGGITIEDRDGTKRITLHADSFRPTIQK